MKARFPARRGWKLGKREQPLKRAIDARPGRNHLQTKHPDVFIKPQPIYFGARQSQEISAPVFQCCTSSLNSKTVVLTCDMGAAKLQGEW
jgi:hypothetical protein